MKRVIAAIESEGKKVAAHPFFARLDDEPIETLIPVLAYNTGFWNMAFQDVIRLVDEAVESPALKVYSRQHRREDSGHHIWFLHDIRSLGYAPGSRVFSWFEDRNIAARAHTYEIFSELYRLKDDCLRVALLLALESPGHVFFGRMSQYMAKYGLSHQMRYFGQSHIKVEKEHTVFTENSEDHLHAIELGEETAREGIAMVTRVHNLFHRLADEMLRQLDDKAWIAELRASPQEDVRHVAVAEPV